jgi:hypothetical protein
MSVGVLSETDVALYVLLEFRGSLGLIDRKLVSGRKRIQEKEIVCQKEKFPVSCGRLRERQNEENTMTRALGTDHGESPNRSNQDFMFQMLAPVFWRSMFSPGIGKWPGCHIST